MDFLPQSAKLFFKLLRQPVRLQLFWERLFVRILIEFLQVLFDKLILLNLIVDLDQDLPHLKTVIFEKLPYLYIVLLGDSF